MEAYHKRALDKAMVELKEDFEPLEIMADLISEGVMKHEDVEMLRAEPTRPNRVHVFVPTLQRRGSEAFPALLRALERNCCTELVKTLKRHEQDLKFQSEEEIAAFIYSSDEKDTFEFLELKLNLGERLNSDDISKLSLYFNWPEETTSKLQRSINPGILVMKYLNKSAHLTGGDTSSLQQVFEYLNLRDASRIVQKFQQIMHLPELKVYISVTGLVQNTEADQEHDRRASFFKGRKLSDFFQEKFDIRLSDFQNRNALVLKIPPNGNIDKLQKEIDSGELADHLLPIIVTEDDVKSLGPSTVENFQVSLLCDEEQIKKTKEMLESEGVSDEDGVFPPYVQTSDKNALKSGEECLTFEDLLERIGLKEKFPGGLGLQHFVKVKDFQLMKDKTDIVELFWEKLSSLDYRARSSIFLAVGNSSSLQQFSIRDFIFAIMQCSDRFLRQDIVEKMSACHLAVPVLLTVVHKRETAPVVEFLLWSLRRIVKKWKESNSVSLEQHIVHVPVFTVSFLRVGEIDGVSKSLIINNLLGQHQGNDTHPYFLSKFDDLCSPKFSTGCLEAIWYLPMNANGSEKLKWVTTFLNLRGDCRKLPLQTKFACKAANLTIVLIAIKNLKEARETIKEIKSAAKAFFFIGINDEVHQCEPNEEKFVYAQPEWLYYHSLELDKIFDHISSKITCCFYESNKAHFKSMESLTTLCEGNLIVEEAVDKCNLAKQLVQKIINVQPTRDLIAFKSHAFPLHVIWKQWVCIDKEPLQADTENEESVEFSLDNIAKRKAEKRQQQLDHKLSRTIELFRRALRESTDNLENLEYFLFYLQEALFRWVDTETKMHLDKISSHEKEIQQLDNLIRQLDPSKSENDETNETKSRFKKQRLEWKLLCQNESEQCRKKSIGWEHFVRELGQWYEAHSELNAIKDDMTMSLPGTVARLLAFGYSLEIMDGDTERVPLSWITSVLDKLAQDLGDPKIFVLCVVGVQSSGKSTLLNSMFGVRFPVRAGRCTRGMFIRLLMVDETYAEKLGVRHVVLIDSEGIRSLERNSRAEFRFDNELVTLALCISDVTILNIEGENIGPEMTGILEIAAHAAIKMKKADLHSQCRIIQQRVSDLTAFEMNKHNMSKIIKTLNEAILVAAKEEGYEDCYQQFSDVFDLRLGENLQFIPCLWTGPMSPPSQFYGEVVSQIKEDILSEVESKKLHPQFTISSFTQRIRDVWGAVKDEMFLFNFQDSIKAVDFNELCMELSKRVTDVSLHLGEKLLLWQKKIQMANADPDFTCRQAKEECRVELQVQKLGLISSLESFVSKHVRKNSLKANDKWLKQNVEMTVTDIENDFISVLQNEAICKKVRNEIVENIAEARKSLLQEAKNICLRLRDDGNDSSNSMENSDPENIFSAMWNQWLQDGRKKFSLTLLSKEAIEATCESFVLSFTTDMAISSDIQKLFREEGGITKHLVVKDWKKYYPEKAGKQNVSEWFSLNHSIVDALVTNSVSKMNEKCTMKPFDGNLLQLILRDALKNFSPPLITTDPPFVLKAKLLLHIGAKLVDVAVENQRLYEVENSFEKLFGEEKQNLRMDFLQFLKSESNIDSAISCLKRYCCAWGKDIVLIEVKNYFATNLTSNLFNANFRINQIVLNELCNAGQAEEYIKYTENYAAYIHAWITKRVVKICSTFQDGKPFLRNHAEQTMILGRRGIINLVNFIEKEAQKRDRTISDDMTYKTVVGILMSGLFDLGFVRYNELAVELNSYQIDDVDVFVHELKKFIHSDWVDEIFQEINLPRGPEDDIATFVKAEFSENINNGLKYICLEQCPLCKTPCHNPSPSGPGHKHFAFTHLPRGIAGVKGTSRLTIDTCLTCMKTNATYILPNDERKTPRPYKTYEQDFPTWSIKPLGELVPNYTVYWKWVLKTYNKQFAEHYQCDLAKIPQSWNKISKENALQSLQLSLPTVTALLAQGSLNSPLSNPRL